MKYIKIYFSQYVMQKLRNKVLWDIIPALETLVAHNLSPGDGLHHAKDIVFVHSTWMFTSPWYL